MAALRFPWARILSAALALVFFGSIAMAAPANQHVILITIDGLAAYYLSDPKAPLATLRQLAAEGAVAEGLRVSNPTMTWPNHTTLVTGVHPEKHSVLFNGVLARSEPGKPVRIDPQRDKSDLVAVPTLFDHLHRAGYRTAAINWPCTRRAATLDDDFPDVPDPISHMTPRLREELVAEGILEGTTDELFRVQSSAMKDQIWTAAAGHVIRRRRPHFMVFHMLIADSTQHKYGPQSPAAYTALALADRQVADVMKAIETAAMREGTTIFITADHGFETALKLVQPNVALRQAGLLEAPSAPMVLRARAHCLAQGGIAMVYLTAPETREEDRAKAMAVFSECEGIAEILRPEKFAGLRMPHPARNRQMADLILVAEPGYAFSSDAHGPEVIADVTLAAGNQGHHGYLSTHPKMNAALIAWGRGIRAGVKLGVVDNIDLAPTMAELLGEKLPGADGKILRALLSDAPAAGGN